MYPYKNKDLELNIHAGNIKKRNHGVLFYSEDKGIASIRIKTTDNGKNIDFTKINLVPYLNLFMEDGSVFTDEELKIIDPQCGQIQYDIPKNVIRHVGEVHAKFILKNKDKSIHVDDFYFTIGDSGLEEQTSKEINIDLIDSKIEQVIFDNANQFKGEKGDDGLSAYEIAVRHGYLGTEEEWVKSINKNSLYLDDYNPDKTGAIPSGSIIQNALNTMEKLKINNLYINDGTYLINRRMYIPDDTNIIMSRNAKLLRGHNGGFFDNGNPNNNVGGYDGKSNIKIVGGILDNNYENIETYPTTQINMIALRHANNITIENVTFRDSITVHCIDVNGTNNLKVKNCTFEGYVNLTGATDKEALQLSEYVTGGIEGGIFDGTPTQNVTVEGCVFKKSDILNGHLVAIGNHISANNVFNNNIVIKNNRFDDCDIGVRMWKWNNVIVENNIFNNIKEAVRITSVSSSYQSANNIDGTPSNNSQAGKNLVIRNNTITNFGSVGIGSYGIKGSNIAYVKNLTIENNNISNGGQGILVELNDKCSISKNNIESCERGIYYKATKNTDISNNKISNLTQENIYSDDGGYTGDEKISSNIDIKNNIFSEAGKNGIFIKKNNIYKIEGNIINNTNNLQLGGALRGGIAAENCDIGKIEGNIVYGNKNDFSIRVNNTTNTNVFNNSGDVKVLFSGTTTGSAVSYYGIDNENIPKLI